MKYQSEKTSNINFEKQRRKILQVLKMQTKKKYLGYISSKFFKWRTDGWSLGG